MNTNKLSLREMKREATAAALADAAFELARERGMDGFVVEDVVQKAQFSRRTFANYFSCKEEAVATAAVMFENANEAEDLIAGLPADADPVDVLHRLLKLQLIGAHLWKMRELMSLSKRHPTLEPYVLSAFRRLQTAAEETVSEFSRGRYPESYPHMLAGAVYGAILPLLDGSLNVLLPGQSADGQSDAATFDDYLETMFGCLRKGF